MKPLHKFLLSLLEEYRKKYPADPPLQQELDDSLGREEYVIAHTSQGVVVRGKDLRSLVYGVSFALVARGGESLRQQGGSVKPAAPLRPLVVTAFTKKGSHMHPGNAHALCQRALRLGCNALVVDIAPSDLQEKLSDVRSFLSVIKSYELQMIGKIPASPAIFSPLLAGKGDGQLESLCERILLLKDLLDTILWEAQLYAPEVFGHPATREYVEKELAAWEVRQVMGKLKETFPLIYSIPAPAKEAAIKQADWVYGLSTELDRKTVLAFSALSGHEPHPLWRILQKRPHVEYCHLMPLFNTGLIQQGEGFWPLLSTRQASKYLSWLGSLSFAAIMGMTSHLPEERSLLFGNLFIASYALWFKKPPSLLADFWFCCYREKCLIGEELISDLEEVHEIVLETKRLLASESLGIAKEEAQWLSKALAARIEYVKVKAARESERGAGESRLYEGLLLCLLDLKRLLVHFLQKSHFPLFFSLEKEDLQPSFWTSVGNKASLGAASHAEIRIHSEPLQGEPGTVLFQAYQEITTYAVTS